MDATTKDTFQQKKVTGTRTYRLLDDGIMVIVKSFGSVQESKIPYDDVDDQPLLTTAYSKQWLRLTIVFAVMYVVLGFDEPLGRFALSFGGLALISATFLLLSWQKYVRYDAGDYWLQFYASVPSDEEVEAFVARIRDRRGQYLKERYGEPMSGDSPTEQVARLHWLREQGALSDAEFEKLKADIVRHISEASSVIGFHGREEDCARQSTDGDADKP